MKVVAFITDYQAVNRIIDYLKLRFVAEKPPPSHVSSHVALNNFLFLDFDPRRGLSFFVKGVGDSKLNKEKVMQHIKAKSYNLPNFRRHGVRLTFDGPGTLGKTTRMRADMIAFRAGVFLSIVFMGVFIACQASGAPADRGPCPRKVAVRVHSETETSFSAGVFIQHFKSLFQSSGVELGEDFAHPEYILAATFERDDKHPSETYLGVTLGFVGGDIEYGGSQGTPYFPYRTHYYGYLITSAWTLAPGGSASDHLKPMAAKFAAKGGLEKIMREFEQIPVKAEAELFKKFYADDTCVDNGDERFINVIKLESGYARNTPYLPQIRLVAHVEKGEILDGEPLSGNEKDRAYMLGTSRGPGTFFSVKYKAPAEGDSDKLIVYNSCDLLYKEIKPLRDTEKKNEILKFDIPICYDWTGTIEYRWSAKSTKGESLLTKLLPGGEYQSSEDWRLWVKFKRDRGNENVEVFTLTSARLELFEEKLDATVMDMRKEDRSIRVEMDDSATARFRKLTPGECRLELAVNLKKDTYGLSGSLDVKNIPQKSKSRMDMVKAPIDHREKDSDAGTTDISQSIEFAGRLATDAPKNARGTKDLMQDLSPDAKKFLKDMGGEQTSIIRWDLVRREKKINKS